MRERSAIYQIADSMPRGKSGDGRTSVRSEGSIRRGIGINYLLTQEEREAVLAENQRRGTLSLIEERNSGKYRP